MEKLTGGIIGIIDKSYIYKRRIFIENPPFIYITLLLHYSKKQYLVVNNLRSPNVLSTRATFIQNLLSRTD